MAGTTADKLAHLQTIKDTLTENLVAKSVTVPEDATFLQRAQMVSQIGTGGGGGLPDIGSFIKQNGIKIHDMVTDPDGTQLDLYYSMDDGPTCGLCVCSKEPGALYDLFFVWEEGGRGREGYWLSEFNSLLNFGYGADGYIYIYFGDMDRLNRIGDYEIYVYLPGATITDVSVS